MPRSEGRSFEELVKAAHRDMPDATDVTLANAERQRLLVAFTSRPRRRLMLASFTTLSLAAAAAVALLWLRMGDAETLSFDVDGAAVATGQYIQARPGDEARIFFSDGSRIMLQDGARGRIETVTADGAAVALEEGFARLAITHTAKSQWYVDAGPFRVQVTGTTFEVKWSSSRQEIEVRLHQGKVVVHGPMTGEGTVLMPGQKLVANVAQATLAVSKIEAPVAREAASANHEPVNVPAEAPAETPLIEPHKPQGSRSHRAPEPLPWSKLVAAGRYDEVLSAARKRGLQVCLRQCPAADVGALADAARYTGQSALAVRALKTQRQRFAHSSEARSAAFLLGRVAEEQPLGAEQALQWYDVYLREAAQGALAPEALGRKMVVLNARHGSARAEPVARLYLDKYPSGPYAALARELLQRRGN